MMDHFNETSAGTARKYKIKDLSVYTWSRSILNYIHADSIEKLEFVSSEISLSELVNCQVLTTTSSKIHSNYDEIVKMKSLKLIVSNDDITGEGDSDCTKTFEKLKREMDDLVVKAHHRPSEQPAEVIDINEFFSEYQDDNNERIRIKTYNTTKFREGEVTIGGYGITTILIQVKPIIRSKSARFIAK